MRTLSRSVRRRRPVGGVFHAQGDSTNSAAGTAVWIASCVAAVLLASPADVSWKIRGTLGLLAWIFVWLVIQCVRLEVTFSLPVLVVSALPLTPWWQVPNGDTHLHYIKQLEAMEITSMVNGAIAEMVDAVKRYYSINRHVDVAIDITYIAYYGDREEFQMSTGAPSNKSYLWCYKMATISIVSEEVTFTLGMQPLRRCIPHMPRKVLVTQLLDIASEHVSIGTVSADAAFDSIGVIHAVDKAGFSYLIRKSSDVRVNRFVDSMDHDVVVKQTHEMQKTIRGGDGDGHPDARRGSLGPQRGYNGDVRDESGGE